MSVLVCLAGVPGSGKTTWAQKFLKAHPEYLYVSPDIYYERINGDECNRDNTFEVWMSMFRDIHTAEQDGRNVLIDSDNLSYAQRNQWIEWFPDFDMHVLLFIEEDFTKCFNRVQQRRRKIPIEIMTAKKKKWENPFESGDVNDWTVVKKIDPNKEDFNI